MEARNENQETSVGHSVAVESVEMTTDWPWKVRGMGKVKQPYFLSWKECFCSHKHCSHKDKVVKRGKAGAGGSDGKLEKCFLGLY